MAFGRKKLAAVVFVKPGQKVLIVGKKHKKERRDDWKKHC